MLDHPAIRNAMLTGYGNGVVPEPYVCPICGAFDIGDVYIDENNEIVGCVDCIKLVDANDIDWE